MRVQILMATTVDGFIAAKDDSVPFVSENHFRRYAEKVKESGNVAIGRRTYEEMPEEEFEEKVNYIVLSEDEPRETKADNIKFVAKRPQELISDLRQRGEEELLVAGGGATNAAFLREGVVDEIILEIMPEALGSGINLFGKNELECELELIEANRMEENELQLRYKVVEVEGG